jgi:hypothetical protein
MAEVWQNIHYNPDYAISTKGRIKNNKKERIMNPDVKVQKYIRVSLLVNGKIKTFAIHRLVAEIFIPNPDKKLYVNHKNRNTKDNNIENLEWCTHSENIIHSYNTNCLSTNLQSNNEIIDMDSLRKEIWKDITFTDQLKDYEISSLGVLRNKNTNEIIKGSDDGRYMRFKNKGINTFAIHRIVACTFIENPLNKPNVNHIDGNTYNNRLENLEWNTQSENMLHANINGLIDRSGLREKVGRKVYKLELDGSILAEYDSIAEAIEKNVYIDNDNNYGSIWLTCNTYLGIEKTRPSNTCGGYGWCFIEDYCKNYPNKSLLNIFPEVKFKKNINYDIIRQFVTNKEKPVWQIELDGTRIKLWNSQSEAAKELGILVSNIQAKHNECSYCGGWGWMLATYDDIAYPEKIYEKIIPKNIIDVFGEIDKSKILDIDILRKNIDVDGNLIIKTFPIWQISYEGIRIKKHPNCQIAEAEVNLSRNCIQTTLEGKTLTSGGFIWERATIYDESNDYYRIIPLTERSDYYKKDCYQERELLQKTHTGTLIKIWDKREDIYKELGYMVSMSYPAYEEFIFTYQTHKRKTGRKYNKLPNTKSAYIGVTNRRQKWDAKIRRNEKTYSLGSYKTEIEAAIAYNIKYIELCETEIGPNTISSENMELYYDKVLKILNKENLTSKYKGVSKSKGAKKWAASISKKGEKFRLGTYDTELEAAMAYDKQALELYGPNYKFFNIIE